MGLNLEDVLKNVIIIDNKIEKNLNYVFDEKLGYLIIKLENLGIGMKVLVVIYLLVFKMSDEIKNILKYFD